eukprot:CAMPEP_0198139590 /NCGR_PEP_ID=MMETSP1443-20131203/2878_1 /TAXON_ID=186043 /ORGANISM="Entomoneis sp., Strain CCMP2396" /LENGTH=132 /DNA_ID=CAMNT_0043801763 /DNA_START=105 /DNA_END=500 /DNA_ORIENTATION=-
MMTPNTRTFWRPGARTVLRILSRFCQLHVYTAAQGTYAKNIMDELDHPNSKLFVTVIHRDLVPHYDHDSQAARTQGKDLTVLFANNDDDALLTLPAPRIVLLDDKVTNFIPQPANGLHVKPYKRASSRLLDW